MIQTILRWGAIAEAVVIVFAADVCVAQSTNCGTDGKGLCNPLNSSFSSIPTFIAGALKVMVQVALPIIALFMMYAGFKFVTARGNSEQINSAKDNFVAVIIGAILILGAWVIATLIGGTITQIAGN